MCVCVCVCVCVCIYIYIYIAQLCQYTVTLSNSMEKALVGKLAVSQPVKRFPTPRVNQNVHCRVLKQPATCPTLLGTVAKLRKGTNRFFHVCPSAWNNSVSIWTDFHEIWYIKISWKSIEKISVSLKSDKNNGYCTWRAMYIVVISRWISFFEWEMFQTKL